MMTVVSKKYGNECRVTPYLRHYHVLTLSDVGVLRLDDSLEELEILHVSIVRLDATDEMLHDTFSHFVAKSCVVAEQRARSLRLQQLAQFIIITAFNF